MTRRRALLSSFLWRQEARRTCKSVSLPATGPKPPPVERKEAEGGKEEAKADMKEKGRCREKGRMSEMKIKC